MSRYRLQVCVDDEWVTRRVIEAADHTDAFRKAMVSLAAEDYTRQIRLEQEAEASEEQSEGCRV